MTNLATLLSDATAADPNRIALKLDDFELSYGLLDEASARVAGLLRARGIGPGDHVGIMLPNVPYFGPVFFGTLRAGASVVPMNVLLREREVAFYLGDSNAKLVFAWHGFADAAQAGAEEAGAECVLVEPGVFDAMLGEAEPVREAAECDGSDTAVVLYTSGTTGTPKGAELTHDNLRSNIEVGYELTDVEGDIIELGALPLFHVFGLVIGLGVCVRGRGLLTLLPRFDPVKAAEIIERDEVNVFLGVPTMYAALLHDTASTEHDLTSLQICVSGGAAMPVEVLRSFEQKFGCKVLEGYGLSETGAVASFNLPDRERKPGSIGVPVDEVQMRVVDDDGNELPQGEVGEIVIRGPNVMKGYWGRPDATADTLGEDGWLRTGDMAYVDEDGYFFIVDRKKDMVIRGGYNVYPREIEEVVYQHPDVREAAVFGVPHETLGEEVAAAIALKAGATADADELRLYVKERVAAYKYPRHVWIVDELPKGPTGKVLKREIQIPAHLRG